MECPRTLDPTECKQAIRHLNGTNNPQLDALNYSNSFTFFNDIQKQRLLETKQPLFRITKRKKPFTMVLLPGSQVPFQY